MAKITIDGTACEYEGRKTILQVAIENGLAIPHYCYHAGLSIVASCRICLAEVAQPDPKSGELKMVPKLLPTCQTPAVDGSAVYTQSEKSAANQKAVMEYLLINHPLDCPVCDQAGECYLQDYSYQYGRGHSRFEEDKIKQPKKDIGPHVYLYSDRCIMCSRCVRFTREVTGTGELCVTGRGNMEEIDVFPGKPLDNELSGNVVDICPVGALLDKDFLFEQRVWFLTATPSIDPITCSGDNIFVDHNQGRIWRVKPRTNMDVNKWWISDEIRYGWKFVHDVNRLTHPMRKHNGAASECDWQEAYGEAVEGVRAAVSRNERVGLMVSPMISCEDAYLLGKAVRAIDGQSPLAVGHVPVVGQDKSFPGGYTIYAEKAPNARGVHRALELLGGQDGVLDYRAMLARLSDTHAAIGAVVIVGGYPSAWADDELLTAIGDRFAVSIDILPNRLTDAAHIVLPGVTWAEKSGTFENIHNRLQAFDQAIAPIEFARPEGQIALDLLAAAGAGEPMRYDAAQVRRDMGGAFVSDVQVPSFKDARQPDVEFVEL